MSIFPSRVTQATPEQRQVILALIWGMKELARSGKKIQALKLWRMATGDTLKEALVVYQVTVGLEENIT